jgi:hypothetical protein
MDLARDGPSISPSSIGSQLLNGLIWLAQCTQQRGRRCFVCVWPVYPAEGEEALHLWSVYLAEREEALHLWSVYLAEGEEV